MHSGGHFDLVNGSRLQLSGQPGGTGDIMHSGEHDLLIVEGNFFGIDLTI